MTGYNNIQAYKKAFASVDKINQVIMLYDTAIASLQQARQAILDKKIEEKFNKISKAFQIITGLRDSLNHEQGGEVASALTEWYSGTSLRILTINRTEDLKMLDSCIEHIKQMRNAWQEVEKQVKSGEGESDASSAINSGGTTGSGPIEAAANDSDYFESTAKAAITSGMNISV